MALTKEEIPKLLQLQTQDRLLDSLQASINKIPKDIQALQDSLDAEKSRVAELKNKANKLQIEKKEKEISLAQKEEAIRKHGQELNHVKTNEAYRALQVEIDKAKSDVSELETAILLLMEQVDSTSREEKKAAAALKDAEAKAQKEIQSLEAEKSKLSAELTEKRSTRDSLAQAIAPEVIKIYDHLRARRQGIALAPVNATMCGACRITLLPQSLVELTRGNKLVACESCQRILYRPESIAETALSARSPAPQDQAAP
ncbi:MAG: hypothetical protein HY551_02190 [Elusimicrobia bacterium]|nr:hypothetical protein [Elusimicrobiota bacterium]